MPTVFDNWFNWRRNVDGNFNLSTNIMPTLYVGEKIQHQEKPKIFFLMSKDERKNKFPSKGGERFSKVGFKKSKMKIFF